MRFNIKGRWQPGHQWESLTRGEGLPWADIREILHGPPQIPNVQNRVKYCRKV